MFVPNGHTGTVRVAVTAVAIGLSIPVMSSAEAPGQWVSLGPISTTWSTQVEVSGRTTAVAVNPSNDRDLWIGTAGGGVWHTYDARATSVAWEDPFRNVPTQAVGSLALANCTSQRCNTVFVGTGEKNLRRDTYYGRGLYRLEWNAAAGRYDASLVGDTDVRFGFGSINKILLLGSDILISVSYGKTSSASTTIVRAPAPQDGYGVFRSSDGGVTWLKLGTNPGGAVPTDIEVSGANLLAGFLGQGLFMLSASNEWCPLGPGPARPPSCTGPISTGLPNPIATRFDFVEIAVAPSSPVVVYAAIGRCDSETWYCFVPPLFFRSADGGNTWTPKTGASSSPIETYSRYTHALTVNPAFPNNVTYGGLTLWRSGDSGDTFEEAGWWGQPHPDVQDLAYATPANRNFAYLSNDGGVYSSQDFLAFRPTWTSINYGVTTMQFYALCHDVSGESGLLMGGTQDNGTQMFNGSLQWELVLGGDGGFCAIESPSIAYATMQEIAPYRSALGPQLGEFESFAGGIRAGDSTVVTPPLLQHPVSKEVFFATNRLYRRRTSDAEWKPISPSLDASPTILPDLERRNVITAVGLARTSPDRIYVGMHDGSLWVTSVCGPCVRQDGWRLVGGPRIAGDVLPDAPITSIEVAPDNADTAYVTYSGFGPQKLMWRTQDGGSNWTDYSNGLPAVPLKVVRAHPDHPSRLWLGSDSGVYFRDGSLMDWTPYTINQGIPALPVYDIRIDEKNDRIYAATHGRGVFMLSDAPVLYALQSWDSSLPRDIVVFAHGFLRARDSECRIALGGHTTRDSVSLSAPKSTLAIDGNGRLRSPAILTNVSWGPALCAGGTPCEPERRGIRNENTYSFREVVLACGADSARHTIRALPRTVDRIGSTLLSVRRSVPSAEGQFRVTVEKTTAGQVDGIASPSVSALVRVDRRDDERAIARRIRDAIMAAPRKGEYPFTARIAEVALERESEDVNPKLSIPFVAVDIKRPGRGQLLTGVQVAPGEAQGLIFSLEGIGQFHLGELTRVEVKFVTGKRGAAGGTLGVTVRSLNGICSVQVNTATSQSAPEIAAALRDALLGRGRAGVISCDGRRMPADLEATEHGALRTSLARSITVSSNDPGIGMAIGLPR